MTAHPAVPLANPLRQYLELREEIDAAIDRVLTRGVFTPDVEVLGFEAEFAEWIGVPHAVGVASGSAALHLALSAIGVGAGDEVVTTANLDISAVAPIAQAGATPIFVDIESASHTMSVLDLERKLSDRVKAIIVVHPHGNPAAMQELVAIAERQNTPLIEDATLSPGGWIGSQRTGSFGTIGCFSLAPTKPLAAFGNVGVVVTRSDVLERRIRVSAHYGFRPDSVAAIRSGAPLALFEYETAGVNASMDELQAAVLRVKLPRIDDWSDRRRAHAALYRSALRHEEGIGVRQMRPIEGARWAPRSFVIEVEHRDRIARLLDRAGVRSALHYVPPLHVQRPFGSARDVGSLPVTERIAEQILCLPVGPELAVEEARYVADALRGAIAEAR